MYVGAWSYRRNSRLNNPRIFMLFKSIFPLLLFLILLSCSNSDSQASAEDKIVNKDSLEDIEMKGIMRRYNVTADWQLKSKFSYELEKIFADSIVALIGYLRDVVYKDNGWGIRVEGFRRNGCIADIIVDSSFLEQIPKDGRCKGLFIIRTQRVTPILTKIISYDGYFNGDPEDEGTFDQVDINVSSQWEKGIYIRGKVLDYFIEKY